MKTGLIAVAIVACTLSGCCLPTDRDAAASKDQHRVDPICLNGKATDVADFQSILADDGMPDVPVCSNLVDADAIGTITRSSSPEAPRQLRVRFTLVQSGKTLLDLSSTDDWPNGESSDEASHRLIKRDRAHYVVKIGMVKW